MRDAAVCADVRDARARRCMHVKPRSVSGSFRAPAAVFSYAAARYAPDMRRLLAVPTVRCGQPSTRLRPLRREGTRHTRQGAQGCPVRVAEHVQCAHPAAVPTRAHGVVRVCRAHGVLRVRPAHARLLRRAGSGHAGTLCSLQCPRWPRREEAVREEAGPPPPAAGLTSGSSDVPLFKQDSCQAADQPLLREHVPAAVVPVALRPGLGHAVSSSLQAHAGPGTWACLAGQLPLLAR